MDGSSSQRAGSANGNLDGGVISDVGDTLSMAGRRWRMGKAGMDMFKRALPMVQYILIMAVVICLPFVMTVSGYSIKVAGTATFGLQALLRKGSPEIKLGASPPI
ncbi:hypothetical protein [Halomonas sp. WWR20]